MTSSKKSILDSADSCILRIEHVHDQFLFMHLDPRIRPKLATTPEPCISSVEVYFMVASREHLAT